MQGGIWGSHQKCALIVKPELCLNWSHCLLLLRLTCFRLTAFTATAAGSGHVLFALATAASVHLILTAFEYIRQLGTGGALEHALELLDHLMLLLLHIIEKPSFEATTVKFLDTRWLHDLGLVVVVVVVAAVVVVVVVVLLPHEQSGASG